MRQKKRGVKKNTKICFLSNFPPKECGIATFTQDLVGSMNKRFNPVLRSKVIAINEPASHFDYDNRVILEVNKEDKNDYMEVARKVNENPDLKLVCIQHEFGIFGGDYGENLMPFLNQIEKPAVVTFHSVLPNPSNKRKKLVKDISRKSAAIVVMAKKALNILTEDYGIEENKIHLIHHGIPSASFVSPDKYKKKLNLDGKKVILTFGLLSRGKGIEYMIKSLPPIVEKHPNLLYLIVGQTHPNVVREEGESYRNELLDLIKSLGLEENVKFKNKYVTTQELVNYILACDIYAFTNLEKAQITSGTLAYALGCGRPVVATPVVYAEELLSRGRGVVIKEFKKPEYFTKALDMLLSDEEMQKNMGEAAYAFGRKMIWPNVAAEYLRVFNRVVKLREELTKKYPTLKIQHLKKMTDRTGCIQFCKGSIPDKSSGYTVDDNSRALMVAISHNHLTNSRVSYNLAKKYLDFLEQSQKEDGGYRNNLGNENEISEEHSDDAIGRAIWSLGYTIRRTKNKELSRRAELLFNNSRKKIKDLDSLRAKAYCLIGLYHHFKKFGEKEDIKEINKIGKEIIEKYYKNSGKRWRWFENKITYDNAKIPESLFIAYKATKNEKYLRIAEQSLNFLTNILFKNGKLMPIGQDGWYYKNGKRALFDQQPIDATSMVLAYISAYEATNDKNYYSQAGMAFNWFLGRNHLKQMLYDETTGGCFDGIGKYSPNLNQGAESTISYLMARLKLEEIKKN